MSKLDIKTHVQDIHTDTRRDNGAEGCFPLSLFPFDPASSNIQYLHSPAWAKVNTAPSKTSQFPSHLLTAGDPKHTVAPVPSRTLSCSASAGGNLHVYAAQQQPAHETELLLIYVDCITHRGATMSLLNRSSLNQSIYVFQHISELILLRGNKKRNVENYRRSPYCARKHSKSGQPL